MSDGLVLLLVAFIFIAIVGFLLIRGNGISGLLSIFGLNIRMNRNSNEIEATGASKVKDNRMSGKGNTIRARGKSVVEGNIQDTRDTGDSQ